MTWQAASFVILVLVLAAGFGWYERRQPPARVVALVGTMAALAVVGRLAFAAIPNVKPTTDIVLFAGYALGPIPGFAVGAITAIASNVFLGQGPWTAWQMVAWGGVGIGGALLAKAYRGREPGRIQLAIVCGIAGLAFGAFMDVYQWTLAARQDLATYLTISASSLPYNLAHAIGNVVFCLLIGPVFIRSLRRYKRRFEVRWAPAIGVSATLALMAVLVLAPAAFASPASRASSYLKSVQNRDGGFGGAKGQGSAQLITGWVALGFESAGINPRQVKRAHGRSTTTYLAKGAKGLRDTGELERTIMVLAGAKLNPRHFAGRDLVAELLRRRHADGSWGPNIGWTAFGIFALRATGFSAGSPTVDAAGKWLESAQNGDGGFGYIPTSESDTDDTGAVLQALGAAGQGRATAAVKAVAYLRKTQNRDGGWGQMEGRSSNTQSTAWVVQGLVAAGVAPASIDSATRFILGLQRRDGHIRYSRSSDQTPAWVTAQALTAIKRKPFPIAPAPLKKVAKHSSAPVAAGPSSAPAAPSAAKAKAHRGHAPKAAADAAATRATTTAGTGKERVKANPASAAAGDTGDGGPSGWLLALAAAGALGAVLAGRSWLHRRRSQSV